MRNARPEAQDGKVPAELRAAPGEAHEKRRLRWRYLVYPRVQLRYVGAIVGVEALVLAVIAWAVFVVVWQPLLASPREGPKGPIPPQTFVGFTDTVRSVVITTLALFVGLGVVCAGIGLAVSHGVAGPLRRLERAIRLATETESYEHRVRLRRGDCLLSLADQVNGLLTRLEERQERHQEILGRVAEVVEAVTKALKRGDTVAEEVLEQTQELEGLMQRALLPRGSA